jgi:histidinol-phosphate aminotransferase
MLIQGYPDPGEGLRLHLNENTGGCSPRVIEAIRRLTPTDISTYPSYTSLVLACAEYFNVDPEWVLLTNGLDEGILMAAIGHISRARIHDAETIVPTPAFDPYPNSTAAAGDAPRPRTPQAFDRRRAGRCHSDAMIFPKYRTTDGQIISIDDLITISKAAPGAIVLIDEAYIEFGGGTRPSFARTSWWDARSRRHGPCRHARRDRIGQPPALEPMRCHLLFNINAIALTR